MAENLRIMQDNERSRVRSDGVIVNKNPSNTAAKAQLKEARGEQGRCIRNVAEDTIDQWCALIMATHSHTFKLFKIPTLRLYPSEILIQPFEVRFRH